MAMTHFADERKRAIKDAETTYNQKVKDLKSDYDTQIFETERGYEDAYRENAVQKAINERQVAESMANMGLRDSGLNRTQQTAVQLGYANNNAVIDKSKRQAVDSFNLQKTRDLASLKQNFLTQKESINQSYDNMEKEYKTESTKAYYQYLSDVAKIENENKNKGYILVDGAPITGVFANEGGLKENGITTAHKYDEEGKIIGVTYYDTKSGKSSYFSLGVSPMTGRMDETLLDENGEYDASRAFAGGYQSRYINVNGKDVKLEVAVFNKDTENGKEGEKVKANDKYGNEHYVMYANGNFYIYDLYNNTYDMIPQDKCADYTSKNR